MELHQEHLKLKKTVIQLYMKNAFTYHKGIFAGKYCINIFLNLLQNHPDDC